MPNEQFSQNGSCESCSSNFSLFKRKKVCSVCKQEFCQSCLTRQPSTISSSSSSSNRNTSLNFCSGNDRICVICQTISLQETSLDDIMKYKIKHLRCYLNAKNIPITTCREKRELAELIVRNRSITNRTNMSTPSPPPPQQQSRGQQQQQQQQQHNYNTRSSNPNQNNRQSRSFNDAFGNFMSSVQDFVNTNVNTAFSNGTGSTTSSSSKTSKPANNFSTCNSSSSTSTSTGGGATGGCNNAYSSNNSSSMPNINPQPQPTSSSTSSTTSSTNSTSFPSNLNDIFGFISEQIPPVVQQTFTNNRFTFNNVFNAPTPAPPPPPSTTQPSSSSSQSTPQPTPPPPRRNENESQSQARQPSPPPPQEQPTIKRRASISDLKCEDDIETLSIKQMKQILASNFVEYTGCFEKIELVDRLKLLFKSHLENRRLENEINSENLATSNNNNNKPNEGDLCKICMDSLIDCVLLECAHMVSCTNCGKRLAECPICRRNVVRVVRVFKP